MLLGAAVLVCRRAPLAEQPEDQGQSVPAALQESHLPGLFPIVDRGVGKAPQQQSLGMGGVVDVRQLRDDRRMGIGVHMPFLHLMLDGPPGIAPGHLRDQRVRVAGIGQEAELRELDGKVLDLDGITPPPNQPLRELDARIIAPRKHPYRGGPQ